MRCPDPVAAAAMIAAIDAAKAAGDTLGGTVHRAGSDGVPVGIGSNRQPDTRLDGILAGALMAMQTVKARRGRAGRERRREARLARARRLRARRTADVVRALESRGRHRGRHEQRPADRSCASRSSRSRR